jgi:hypothetical protein
MRYNPLVATVTVALGALSALGAVIYQAVGKGAIDGELLGFTGLLFGAFLRAPSGTTEDRQAGAVSLTTVAVVLVILCCLVWLVANVDVRI